jgi:hypothetical protein
MNGINARIWRVVPCSPGWNGGFAALLAAAKGHFSLVAKTASWPKPMRIASPSMEGWAIILVATLAAFGVTGAGCLTLMYVMAKVRPICRMCFYDIETSERQAIMERFKTLERRRNHLNEAIHSQIFLEWLKTCQSEHAKLPKCD